MNPSGSRRGRGDAAATLVEAAFVLPLFLLMLFALIEFGYNEYLDSQSSSAARDGARVGILTPDDHDAIEKAVQARLVGLDPDDITIRCLEGLSGNTVIADCADADPNSDRIEVSLTTTRPELTPVGFAFGSPTLKATARMVITGLPVGVSAPPPASTTTTTLPGATTTTTSTTTTTTAPPGSCQVTSVLPAAPITFGNGTNADNYTEQNGGTTITVTASTNCTGLVIQFPNGSQAGTYTDVALTPTGTPGQFSAPLGRRAYSVPVGTHRIRVVSSVGVVLNDSLTITRSA